MYVVILAGGGGTRLRPLSTSDRPKPFLPLIGERSLLQATVERVVGADLGIEPGDVTVVVADAFAPLVRTQVPEVEVLAEPFGRNTAPAIALAALAIERDPEEVMVVLPADHAVGDEAGFRRTLAAAAAELAGGAFGIEAPLVTLGVAPTRPAIEYGHLIPDRTRGHGPALGTDHRLDAHPLRAFEEKPAAERAAELAGQPGVAWNAGMFVWRRQAILDAIAAFAPDTLATIVGGLAGQAGGGLERAYEAMPPTAARSIDYAVMEPAAADGRVVMGTMAAGWSDVGTWAALLEVLGASGVDGRVVEAGETTPIGPDDLLVERLEERCVAVAGPPADGTMTADAPTALLRAARPHRGIVDALLDRCAAWEVRS